MNCIVKVQHNSKRKNKSKLKWKQLFHNITIKFHNFNTNSRPSKIQNKLKFQLCSKNWKIWPMKVAIMKKIQKGKWKK